MSRVAVHSNHRVVVYPRDPGDMGVASISGVVRSHEDTVEMCEDMASSIREHCPDLPSGWQYSRRGVSVEWDTEHVCGDCGYPWTETTPHNGGCCAADCARMDAVLAIGRWPTHVLVPLRQIPHRQ